MLQLRVVGGLTTGNSMGSFHYLASPHTPPTMARAPNMLIQNPDDPNLTKAEALPKFQGHKGQLLANNRDELSHKAEARHPAPQTLWCG